MSILLYAAGAICIFGSIFAVLAMSASPLALIAVPVGIGLTWLGVWLYIKAHPIDEPPPQIRYQRWRTDPAPVRSAKAEAEDLRNEIYEISRETAKMIDENKMIDDTSAADHPDIAPDKLSDNVDSINYKLGLMADRLEKIEYHVAETRKNTEATAFWARAQMVIFTILSITALIAVIVISADPIDPTAGTVVLGIGFFVCIIVWLNEYSGFIKRQK